MRRALTAAAFAGLSVSAASAATVERRTGALPVAPGVEMLATVGNTCAGRADYVATFRNARTGERMKRKVGTVSPGRAVVLSAKGTDVAMEEMVLELSVTCDGSVAPQPLVGVYLRDARTLEPHITGDVFEGTGI